jgi:hypothetical protein
MKSPAPTQAITDADADIACVHGEAAVLSQYLSETDAPSINVVCSIAWDLLATDERRGQPNKEYCRSSFSDVLARYLSKITREQNSPIAGAREPPKSVGPGPGPDNWKLVFSTRTGRPPKNQPQPADAAQALATGQAIPAGMYLLANPEIDEATQRILAAVLDPRGTSKWQLKFVRPRRKGNPRSDLRTAINQAVINDASENVHARAKARGEETNWDAIYPQVKRALEQGFPSLKASSSSIRAARAAVKRARGKNPPL